MAFPCCCWLVNNHTTFPWAPAPSLSDSTEQTAACIEGSWWHVHLCTWPWDCKSQGSHEKCRGGKGNQMGYTTHWKKMGLGILWALGYHIKQFVAARMGVVKGLGTEWMLCWRWMEKSGLVSSCCESRCETAYEMLLWQVQSIGHHYQPFTQLIRERSRVIFILIPKDILGLLHTLPHRISIYTPRSLYSYKHSHT